MKNVVYIVDNEERYASDYFIGKVDDTIVIEGWGYILNLLESRWGYLFCIVVVSLLLFLQEVFELVMEIKYLNKLKKQEAIEVEADEEDEEEEEEEDDEEEPERIVKAKTTKSTKKASGKTATKSSATSKTASKTASKTSSTKKASTTKKTGTTKKAATATTKAKATKSSKEEE